jgi:predicted anti-sigma-YlaC factor YlaD
MNCQRIARMLSARQDGELNPALEREVETHLRDCAACRDEWNGLQRVLGSLRLVPPPASDPFFPTRVMAGLPARSAAGQRVVRAAAYALAFVLIFTGGFFLQTNSPGRSLPGPAAATFSAVLLEPQDLGLLSVHDDTLNLFAENRHE